MSMCSPAAAADSFPYPHALNLAVILFQNATFPFQQVMFRFLLLERRPLSQRPWSINTYALPKVWFWCHSLELWAGDISKINSHIKSWLYADCLEKPEELVMQRPRNKGGLGEQNVRYKAVSILILRLLCTMFLSLMLTTKPFTSGMSWRKGAWRNLEKVLIFQLIFLCN